MAEALAESINTVLMLETGKDPLPPFAYNVYIAHSLEDSLLVSGPGGSLCKILEKKKFKCLPRYVKGDNSPIKSRIDEGVRSSEKCLILMTDSYRADENSHYEIQKIHDKAKRFNNDMVIVVWPRLREGDEFNIYTNIENIPNLESFCNESCRDLSVLARSINKVPDASLTCLPKINIGFGAASGFYYGYLSLVLPDFRKRFRDATLKDPMAEPGMLNRSVCKMIIILPLSCLCPPSIPDAKSRIKNVDGFYVKRWANRAGNVRRDYKSSVYKLVNEITQEEYYFAGELATPLLTMYESYLGVTGLTLPQLGMERDAFCFTLHQILNHPENRECNNQYRLIMWDDGKDDNGEYRKSLYELLLPILKKELENERLERENASLVPTQNMDSAGASDNIAVKSVNHTTFEIVGENQQSMTAFYEKMQFASYPLRNSNRGKALIINIVNFQASGDSTVRQLKKREGGNHDGDKMEQLFRDLGFETDVHLDVNRHRLGSILMMYNSMDHSNYDAFICCIMTHGNLGEIYTSDCLPYAILDIVDMFSSNNCSSLRGKPKLFFVQSCQKEADEDSPQGAGLHSDNTVRTKKLKTDSDRDDTNSAGGGTVTKKTEAVNRAMETEGASGCMLSRSRSGSSGTSSPFEFLSRNPELKACLVPGEPDIVMSYSALPGSISYRDPHRGSLYIAALDNNLRKELEIDRALKKVTEDVGDKLLEHKKQQQANYAPQLPFHFTTGMSKCLYLKVNSGESD